MSKLLHIGRNCEIYGPNVFLKPEVIYIGNHTRIDAFVRIEGGQGVSIGDYCHIASQSVLNNGGGQLTFGSHSTVAAGTVIATGFPDTSRLAITPMEPSDQIAVTRLHTIIGEYVLIFSRAVLSPGITVGDGAVIRAGAVVTKNVEPFTIVQGVPAVSVGTRVLSTSEQAKYAALKNS